MADLLTDWYSASREYQFFCNFTYSIDGILVDNAEIFVLSLCLVLKMIIMYIRCI